MDGEEKKKVLRENIKLQMYDLKNAQEILQRAPQGNIDIGWKRKGRELGFVL